MLVLTRKPGERIMIGSSIEVTVVDVRRDYVRLGFEAPPEVSIRRTEVHRRIRQEEAPADLLDKPAFGE